jgi:hypothetical protein
VPETVTAEAVKEQQGLIKELKAKNEKLEQRLIILKVKNLLSKSDNKIKAGSEKILPFLWYLPPRGPE